MCADWELTQLLQPSLTFAAPAHRRQVANQHGYWTAAVDVCGEPFQAFFESREAATDALEVATVDRGAAAADARVTVETARERKKGETRRARERSPPAQRRASLGQLADIAALLPGLHSLAAAAAM